MRSTVTPRASRAFGGKDTPAMCSAIWTSTSRTAGRLGRTVSARSPSPIASADTQVPVCDLQCCQSISGEPPVLPELDECVQRKRPVLCTHLRLHLEMDKPALPADPHPRPRAVRFAVRTLVDPTQHPNEAALPRVVGPLRKSLEAFNRHTSTIRWRPRCYPRTKNEDNCGDRASESTELTARSFVAIMRGGSASSLPNLLKPKVVMVNVKRYSILA